MSSDLEIQDLPLLPSDDVHLDLTAIPPALASDDAPSQSVILQYGDAPTSEPLQRAIDNFHGSTPYRKTLKYVKDIYETNRKSAALQMLTHRYNIDWRKSDYVTTFEETDELLLDLHAHYLDMVVLVSSGLGLGAILPRFRYDPSWEIMIEPTKKHTRTFDLHGAKLGFNPTHRMLWIGQTNEHEDLWLALVPQAFEEDDVTPMLEDLDYSKGSTVCSKVHYRIMIQFLAYLLKKLGKDIYVAKRYPRLDDDDDVYASTNLWETGRRLQLSLRDTRQLDSLIQQKYHGWLEAAPDSYKDDGMFASSIPIAVTSRCGQNQELPVYTDDDDIDEELETWKRYRNFERIRFMSVSLASHFDVIMVDQWYRRPSAFIIRAHGDNIYDSVNPEHRQRLSPEEVHSLPAGERLYTKHGYEIATRLPVYDEEDLDNRCGIIVDFQQIQTLFEPDHGGMLDYPRAGPTHTKYRAFPQAGLHTAGHVQASGLLTDFYPLLERINKSLVAQSRDVEAMDIDDDDGLDHSLLDLGLDEPAAWPVYGVSCQMYNAVMHSTRGKGSQHHEVLKGKVTAALGSHVTTETSSSHHGAKLRLSIARGFPHAHYRLKSENTNVSKQLRLENTFWIDIRQLPDSLKSGDQIFKNILKPLMLSWNHDSLLQSLKDNTVILTSEAFPAIYNWMTYPLTVLIEHIWEEPRPRTHGQVPNLTSIEVCAMAERALNYMHTGNTAVLATRIMNPFWPALAVIHDGWPCFNPDIVRFGDGEAIRYREKVWPFDKVSRLPLSAASSGQKFYFGSGHAKCYLSMLAIDVSSRCHVSPPYTGSTKTTFYDVVAYQLIQLLLNDITDLIWRHCGKAIERQCDADNGDVAKLGRKRKAAYREWSKRENLLSWEASTVAQGRQSKSAYALLLVILNEDAAGGLKRLPMSAERQTSVQLATRMIHMTRPLSSQSIAAPIMTKGYLHQGLQYAQSLLRQRTRGTTDRAAMEQKLAIAIALSMDKLKINLVPWHGPMNGRSVPRAPTPAWWLTIAGGGGATRAVNDDDMEVDEPETLAELATQQSLTAPWQIPETLMELVPLLHKTSKPEQWDMRHASVTPALTSTDPSKFVYETYSYVDRIYDGANWIHHMALVWSIVFTRLLPQITYKVGTLPKHMPGEEATGLIRRLAWVSPNKEKGVNDPNPFLVQLTTNIISLLDERSPLREHLARSQNKFGIL